MTWEVKPVAVRARVTIGDGLGGVKFLEIEELVPRDQVTETIARIRKWMAEAAPEREIVDRHPVGDDDPF